MSERMTTIKLRGVAGLADWGHHDASEMIAMIRDKAWRDMRDCQSILSAQDRDFHIYTHTGVHVQKNKKVLQEGLPSPPKDGE